MLSFLFASKKTTNHNENEKGCKDELYNLYYEIILINYLTFKSNIKLISIGNLPATDNF